MVGVGGYIYDRTYPNLGSIPFQAKDAGGDYEEIVTRIFDSYPSESVGGTRMAMPNVVEGAGVELQKYVETDPNSPGTTTGDAKLKDAEYKILYLNDGSADKVGYRVDINGNLVQPTGTTECVVAKMKTGSDGIARTESISPSGFFEGGPNMSMVKVKQVSCLLVTTG